TLRSMVTTYLSLTVIYLVPSVAYLALTRLADCERQAAMWVGVFSPFFAAAALEDASGSFLSLFLPSGGAADILLYHLTFIFVACGALLVFLFHGYDRYCRFRREHETG
ncbi:MAG: hypothetical protein N3A66_05870, partial [Planctomycetota bacterium]|nr:hypothetical protein [Planctomycetota bacterium]